MNILIVGKFPPIEGGVSMRTYWLAHGLAQQGHKVHVLTNANEVEPAYRMYMRPEDWKRVERRYRKGYVKVHHTATLDRSQSHIPQANPFVSKLVSLGLRVGSKYSIDLVFSFYLEPYGVAGHIISQTLKCPHIVRTAGSDAGRLWRHDQLSPFYDVIFKSAAKVWTSSVSRRRLLALGISPESIWYGPSLPVHESFNPSGCQLDVPALLRELHESSLLPEQIFGTFRPEIPYFGIYGKINSNKGVLSLLDALGLLVKNGYGVGLLIMGHGRQKYQSELRVRIAELGLAQHVVQLPFLPHWRVPDFIRSCIAVCCLEQDFPIEFHSPVIAREVLSCGACLVGSKEVIRKLPDSVRLVDGYNCVIIENVRNTDELAGVLGAILREPERATDLKGRAFAYSQSIASDSSRFNAINELFCSVATEKLPIMASTTKTNHSLLNHDFFLSKIAIQSLTRHGMSGRKPPNTKKAVVNWVDKWRVRLKKDRYPRNQRTAIALSAIELELFIIRGIKKANHKKLYSSDDAHFRLEIGAWALKNCEFNKLTPVHSPLLCVKMFNFGVGVWTKAYEIGVLPSQATPSPTWLALLPSMTDGQVSIHILEKSAASVLSLCDGRNTVADISNLIGGGNSDQTSGIIEQLFNAGLVVLGDAGGAMRQISNNVEAELERLRSQASLERAELVVRG